jgi:serine/threonine protein kinase
MTVEFTLRWPFAIPVLVAEGGSSMPPSTGSELVELIRKSGLVETTALDEFLGKERTCALVGREPKQLAARMIQEGLLTQFQARQLLQGKWRGFEFGKYRVLEQLGGSSNSAVYLCEHLLMRRRVAIKVLPTIAAESPAALGRFQREARAAAALDHPNIVHTYDSGQEGDLHYLVMEYVDGFNLQEIVQKHGSMDAPRAAHYIRQAAAGLQHVFEAGLIHRDVKPANLLLDRKGIVRVLDLGLARFFHDHQDLLTLKYDGDNILGTADYLSPEQARDSHQVDIRADIYSLGATFYFLLTGRPPFQGKSVAQKLLQHQIKKPTPVRDLRPEIPEKMAAVLARMMAKEPPQRYATPAAVSKALSPWTRVAIPPPRREEMPQLCLAARGMGALETDSKRVSTAAGKAASRSLTGSTGTSREAAVAISEPPRQGATESASSSAITQISKRRPETRTGGSSRGTSQGADTHPAISRADTDPQLPRNLSRDSPVQAPAPRRRLLPWMLGATLVPITALGRLLRTCFGSAKTGD